MLDIYFFNVGDGDSTLLSLERENSHNFNILIDTGRNSLLEIDPKSKRAFSSKQMAEIGVDHIDVMMITHLHTDHMGHIIEIAKKFPIFKAIVPYIPSKSIDKIPPESEIDPYMYKYPDFTRVIKEYTNSIEFLRNQGCFVETAWDEAEFSVDGLELRSILPKSKLKDQIEVYERLINYTDNPNIIDDEFYKTWHDITEIRNPDSLMELVNYEGLQLLFAGDRYGKTMEDWSFGACDLIKIPHHGDPKSLTEAFLTKISPKYGIISCQMNVRKGKDRPNNEIIQMLQAHNVEIYCTENRELPTLPESSCKRLHARIINGQISIDREF